MKCNTPRGAAQRYISAKGLARKEGDLEFLNASAKSFALARPAFVPRSLKIPAPIVSMTIFEIVMKQREVRRG